MAAPLEVIVTSDSGSQLWNSTVFDLHSGSSLLSYRGGNSAARTLTVLNGEYLLSAQLGKNFINMWEIQRKDQLQQKMVCQGLVNCVTASRNGLFLLAGVAETVYLWEVSTGKLLSVLSRHYQDITCLMFTDDSSHFVSGGKDNLAVVWSISSVIQLDLSHTPEPRHVLSRHSLPITDLHCGLMGAQARVATASLDQTVKVWELSSGELLLSVLFDVEIMSVTFDPCEYFLFCGGSDGNIFQVSLCSQSLSRDKTFQSDNDGNQVFKGHRNLVTCLSVSMDGTLLLSGSHDETARLWDVQSKQSIRCLAHKGACCWWESLLGLSAVCWHLFSLRLMNGSTLDHFWTISGILSEPSGRSIFVTEREIINQFLLKEYTFILQWKTLLFIKVLLSRRRIET
uniref:WD repeat domain 18 n=1 Tax=Gasterosteus aculeatus aculeatus TaxID=481459 RepID=A0AAQ4QV33_GASAC|nr:WD repeat-containing protein 18 isoform X2 [Gasterosteus aculeatus aculeatus]